MIASATCADDDSLGRVVASVAAGSVAACVLGDGGVAFRISPRGDAAERRAYAMASVEAFAISRMAPERATREVLALDRESRLTDARVTTPGLIQRAPDRTLDHFVRLEGVAHDVHERGGETTLRVWYDLIGRQPFEVVFPGIASDAVVDGARVVIYGMHGATSIESSPVGDVTVPRIYASYVLAR